MSPSHRNYLELDDRRRTSLGKFGRKSDTRYLVEEHDDGTLFLIPAVVVSQRDLEMLANPKRMESIRQGVKEAKAGKSVRLDPVALLADLEGKKTPTAKSGRKDGRR